MTTQHTTYNKLKKSAKQYQIEDRRRQVAIMVAQGISEVEIAAKLGVDNTTISKDIKALKLISQQRYRFLIPSFIACMDWQLYT